MCIGLPKAPKVPIAPERQAMQQPKDLQGETSARNQRSRRGLWASIFTSPAGLSGPPTVTGTGGSITGG